MGLGGTQLLSGVGYSGQIAVSDEILRASVHGWFDHSPFHHTIPPPSTPSTDMGLRDSFLKLLKKLNRRLAGDIHEPGRSRTGVTGERAGRTGSAPRPELHLVAEPEHGQQWNGNGVEESQRNLDPNLKDALESGPRHQGNSVDGEETSRAISSPPYTSLNSYCGKPDAGMCASYLNFHL